MYTELDRIRLEQNLSGYTWTNEDKSIFFAFFNKEVWFIVPERDVFYATYQTVLKDGIIELTLKYKGGEMTFYVSVINDHRIIFKDDNLNIRLKKVASYKWL